MICVQLQSLHFWQENKKNEKNKNVSK